MELTHQANPVRVNARHIVKFLGSVLSADGKSHDVLVQVDDGSTVSVTAAMSARYTPVVGDYIVTQEDGYVYVNPKDVFERKYSAIPKPKAEIYSRPECRFNYCPHADACSAQDRCQYD